ncbi:hypothetical protein AC1031_021973 [Aphanomyces cochlioides]|nr:hypothetical protein AC1031_021973 [Aphanomyces cochlioides]
MATEVPSKIYTGEADCLYRRLTKKIWQFSIRVLLKCMQATKYQMGGPKDSGKDPLPYSLYQALCRAALKRQDNAFAHFFLTTQWNLMCRSESVQTLCTEHLSSQDDSIGCVMYKSKTNQEGSGPIDPRHMYANPLNPSICWITSLAIYLACRPTQSPGPLFPGSQQKARFGQILRQMVVEMQYVSHYGTDSVRKGVATFACSGSTGGPSIASVCLRVGWSLGGVQDRYIRYESAADQYLGRVVAGLPLNSGEFSSLPPHFRDNHDQFVGDVVEEMYPSLKSVSNLYDVLRLCIASLVQHYQFLQDTLPKSHSLLSTYIFRNPEVV